MLRGVVYRLIESLASVGYSSVGKLICASSVCNTLTVGVHQSSTPSISGPGSATGNLGGPKSLPYSLNLYYSILLVLVWIQTVSKGYQ